MPLYRGFFKKGPTTPTLEPVDPTRRIVRPDPAAKARPASPPAAPAPAAPAPTAPAPSTEPVAPSFPGPASPSGSTASVAVAAPTAPVLVAGWLAIISGPGRGQVLTLGYGINDIGSGPGARIRLDFGDTALATDNHAAIIYTTRSRRFYLACSAFREVWLNDAPAPNSAELTGGETIRLGQTRLRFFRLCGPDFDWRDSDD